MTKSRLSNYVKKAKEVGLDNIHFKPNFKQRLVFPNEMEEVLEEYLLKSQKIFYGLTAKKCRELAYQYAEKNNLKFPELWNEKKQAGKVGFRTT